MSESLFRRSLAALGPIRTREQLAGVPLASFASDLPEEFASLSALDALDYLPELVGRHEQLMPEGAWSTWVFMAGRGSGKTWAGSVATITVAKQLSALVAQGRMDATEARLHVVAATASDLRDTITEGPAGLLRLSPPWFPATFEPSKRRVSWPNGVQAVLISADEPERARGLQCAWLWADEFASWRFAEEIWPNLQLGLRLGPNPRSMITTTPRPGRMLRDLLAQPTAVVTRASTRDNAANLAPSAVERLYAQYGSTRLGRQELEAELLTDNPAALWKLADIDRARVAKAPTLRRVIVAVDPAVSSHKDSDETGIIVAGIAPCTCKGTKEDHVFVVEDASGTYTPDQWARATAGCFERHRADRVVCEANQGGDLVVSNLRTLGGRHLPVTKVHATRGKVIRAEPISALYEQGKAHHVGAFSKLEDQLCNWNPTTDSTSPDRLDALVWALTHLALNTGPNFVALDMPGPYGPRY